MRLVTSEGNTTSDGSPFAAWMSAVSQSSDAALGAALAVHALGAADALCAAANEEGAWGQVRDIVEAIARPQIITAVTQLRAYCMDVTEAKRWAILVPRSHTLVDIVVWEQGGVGLLAVVPMVHRGERFAHVGWLANASSVPAAEARDALACWVLTSPDAGEARSVLRPYAWLLDVDMFPTSENIIAL